jgi:hypothetical protein
VDGAPGVSPLGPADPDLPRSDRAAAVPHRDPASVEAFFDWLDRFAERPIRGLHLVLAMREDYLGRFRDRARGRHRLLENGFRLGPMTVGEIVGAVCRGAADGAPPQKWSPAAMRR